MMKSKATTTLGRYTITECYRGGHRTVDREYGTGRLLKVHTKRRKLKSQGAEAPKALSAQHPG